MKGIVEPLGRYTCLRTRDVAELEAFLANTPLRAEPAARRPHNPKLDALINVYNLPNTCVSYFRYRSPVEHFAHSGCESFSLLLPAKGTFCAKIGTEQVHGGRGMGSLGSPTLDQRTSLNEESSRYAVYISPAAIVHQLESLLGSPLTAPLRFAAKVDFHSNAGRSLRSLIQLLVDDLEQDESAIAAPLVAAQFEQLLIAHLLTHQPHNYASQLARWTPPPASRDVRRVLDYVQEHLDESITLDQLVTVSGVAGRSLHAHFRHFTGKSPLAYVAEQRLARARSALMEARDGDTVTTIARQWGFTQLGRFSGVYRRTFGELPSATLRRARSRVSST